MARWFRRVRLDGAGHLLFSAGVFSPSGGYGWVLGEPAGRGARK